MTKRRLGTQGLEVAPVGYGAMVLEGYYGDVDDAQAVRTLQHAVDVGVTMIDSADAYGNGRNEGLVGRALRGRDAVIATKFGIVFDGTPATDFPTGWGFSLPICGSPAYARKSLDRSLKALGADVIDLWYLHYPEPGRPIEETIAAMSDAVKAGKVRWIGVSNVTAAQVRAAHAVHPLSAVQNEYSLWRREAERDLFPTLRDLGIGFVPWSPLGSGFLAGVTQVKEGDFRANNPKFTGNNAAANIDRFAPIHDLAKTLGITSAQLALAWILAQSPDIVPIPGTRTPSRIEENLWAAEVTLSDGVLRQVDAIAPIGAATGGTLL